MVNVGHARVGYVFGNRTFRQNPILLACSGSGWLTLMINSGTRAAP